MVQSCLLYTSKVNSPDATHLPVRLGVAILKDREGKIVLDVPIEGSIDDPKFRISKVVERAIVNILEKVATSPFSLLGALFGGGGEELGYQDFAAGSAALTADAVSYTHLDVYKRQVCFLGRGLCQLPALIVFRQGLGVQGNQHHQAVRPRADEPGRLSLIHI